MEKMFLQPKYFAVTGRGSGEQQNRVRGVELPSHSVFCSTPSKSLHPQAPEVPNKLERFKKKKKKKEKT